MNEIRRTVNHEITHAVQESERDGEGESGDEEDAENAFYLLGEEWKNFLHEEN